MGPTVCSLSSCSPLLLPFALLPFALRLFQWQQTFVARRELLDVQNGVVGCLCLCVCCVCFVLAVSNRFSVFLLFLQTVFSNFLNVLRVCCWTDYSGQGGGGGHRETGDWYSSRCTFVSATVHSVLIYSRSLSAITRLFVILNRRWAGHVFCRCAWLRRMQLLY